MTALPQFMSREIWLRHLFSSQAAQDGGVVRRKIRDIDRFVGREVFSSKCGAAALRWSRTPDSSLFSAIANRSVASSERFLQRNRTGAFKGSGPEFSKTPVGRIAAAAYRWAKERHDRPS
jgi:hypothetical protein